MSDTIPNPSNEIRIIFFIAIYVIIICMDENVKDENNPFSKNQEKVQPIFDSSSFEAPQVIKPEEVSPDIAAPDLLSGGIPDFPSDIPPVYEESKSKMFIIIGAVVFFILILTILLVVFFSNRKATDEPPKQTTLTYWGLWEEKELMDPIIADYQKANPHVTIKYEKMAPQEYRKKLLARSKTGQAPDIFRFHNTWLPQIQEVVAPLPNTIMSNQEFESTFYKVHQKDLKIGDNYYGIPLSIDGLVLIYNEDLLKQAGLVSPPTVWFGDQNDVLTAVGKMTVKDGSGTVVTSGLAMGNATNVDHFAEIFGYLMLLNGGDLKKLDSPEAAEALQVYRKLGEENIWTDAMPNSTVAFTQGKVAMIIAPSWQVLTIKGTNPDLNVKVVPLPKGLQGSSVSLASYWVEGVSKVSPNQVEAWKFLTYLSQKEQMTKRYELQSKNRLFGEAYSRVDLADKLITHEYLGPVIQQADSYVSLPVVDRTYDEGLNDEIVQYLRNAINATQTGVGYEASLNTAKQGVDQVFEKYKIQ